MIYLVIVLQFLLVGAGIAFQDLSKLVDMAASFSILVTSFVLRGFIFIMLLKWHYHSGLLYME